MSTGNHSPTYCEYIRVEFCVNADIEPQLERAREAIQNEKNKKQAAIEEGRRWKEAKGK